MNNCSGLYLSSGNYMKDVPGQQIEHYSWMPVEQTSSFSHTIGFTFNRPVSEFTHALVLMTYGKSTLVMKPAGNGYVRMQLRNSGTSINWPSPTGWKFPVTRSLLHEHLQISVTIDPNLSSIIVGWYGDEVMINHYIAGTGPAIVKPTKVTPGAPEPVVTVTNLRPHSGESMALCRSLTQSH
jgi:hypothetical protein